MINFDDVTKKKEQNKKTKNKKIIKERNLDWSQISDHLYRILIIRGSGSGETNSFFNLLNQQSDIEKTDVYGKDPYEAENQFLIKKRKSTDLSILTILKILLNTQIIWMIFTKILKNTMQTKNEKF